MMEIRNKLRALEDHLKDGKQRLDKGDFDADHYFTSYLLLYKKSDGLAASNGRLVDEFYDTDENSLRAEVRVGDYGFDGCGSVTVENVPVEDDYVSMRNLLWEATWPAFRMAQLEYLEKQEECLETDRHIRVKSFRKIDPVKYRSRTSKRPRIMMERWKDFLRDASAEFNRHSAISSSMAGMGLEEMLRIYVNSEGSRVVQHDHYYSLSMVASTIAPDDGETITLQKRYFTRDIGEFPPKRKLRREVRGMIDDLMRLREAPVQRAGTYPAIFDPDNTEVLFHEIVGHRLEGERQDSDWEGDTFEGKIGEQVAPDFVTLVDDPTKDRFTDCDGRTSRLVGHYRYDDEGVRARKVTLIENGVLRNYLTSRKPVEGYDGGRNGHGRTEGSDDPIARMSNLIVYSRRPVSSQELRERLFRECLRQDKDYGLVFENTVGGYTDTDNDYFRIFPQKCYRLYARDAVDKDTGNMFRRGDMQLVRGVGVTGTPLTILKSLVGMDDRYRMWPGVCGAESGWVKVSGVAPSSVFSRIEVRPVEEKSHSNPLPKPSTYIGRKGGGDV